MQFDIVWHKNKKFQKCIGAPLLLLHKKEEKSIAAGQFNKMSSLSDHLFLFPSTLKLFLYVFQGTDLKRRINETFINKFYCYRFNTPNATLCEYNIWCERCEKDVPTRHTSFVSCP